MHALQALAASHPAASCGRAGGGGAGGSAEGGDIASAALARGLHAAVDSLGSCLAAARRQAGRQERALYARMLRSKE